MNTLKICEGFSLILASVLLLINCTSSRAHMDAVIHKQNQEINATAEPANASFRLVGAGTFVYAGLFNVYDVLFYTADETPGLKSKPKKLVFHYNRSVSGAASRTATQKAILLNATEQDVTAFGASWDQLLNFYEDVNTGDRLILTHDHQGLHLIYPEKNKSTTISNHMLADKMFSIWIGPQPLSDQLKNALLSMTISREAILL